MYPEKSTLIVAPEWERVILKNILQSNSGWHIIREVSDTYLAIKAIEELDVDYVFTELELTRGDGIELLEFLRDREDVRVIVVSRLLRYSSPMLFEELGKFRPDMIIPMTNQSYEVNPLTRVLKMQKPYLSTIKNRNMSKILELKSKEFSQANSSVIVIGGSTGALTPLYHFLEGMELNDRLSIVIALHTLKTRKNVEKVKQIFGSCVREVQGLERFELGRVYVLRSGRNYRLIIKNGELYFKAFRHHLALRYRPSINLVMENFSAIFQEKCIGVILSGYGSDGVLGSELIAMRGGRIIIQDPENAKAPSMPSLTIEALRRRNKTLELIKL